MLLPKDLLDDLEKGDRTIEILKMDNILDARADYKKVDLGGQLMNLYDRSMLAQFVNQNLPHQLYQQGLGQMMGGLL